MAEEDDPDFLDKLAESVADGDSIDWKDLEGLPPDDIRRQLLENLRLVAEIAEQHRSPVEEPMRTPPAPSHDRCARGASAECACRQQRLVTRGLGRWGHLELRRKIGEGAFGEVFHAHDSWLDHPVALKLLKPEIAQTDHSSRILHEARRLARVRHPNVVSVHGADMHDGRIGFWMDLIEGETLSALVSAGRLSPGEAAHIGQEVCLALAAVHHANLVHRDVKAQNVMRASDGGRIILMDFGAGEFIGKRSNSGRVRGTPLYLAPEIFEGADATIASDIYALGVLLFHLVTGGFPVNGTSVESLVDAHMKGERRRLHDARPDLPASFVTIVERAIDPDPERRFASAGDFYAALMGEGKKGTEQAREESRFLRTLRRAGIAVAGVLIADGSARAVIVPSLRRRCFEIDPMFAARMTRLLERRSSVDLSLRDRMGGLWRWRCAARGTSGAGLALCRHLFADGSAQLSERVDPYDAGRFDCVCRRRRPVPLTWSVLGRLLQRDHRARTRPGSGGVGPVASWP